MKKNNEHEWNKDREQYAVVAQIRALRRFAARRDLSILVFEKIVKSHEKNTSFHIF